MASLRKSTSHLWMVFCQVSKFPLLAQWCDIRILRTLLFQDQEQQILFSMGMVDGLWQRSSIILTMIDDHRHCLQGDFFLMTVHLLLLHLVVFWEDMFESCGLQDHKHYNIILVVVGQGQQWFDIALTPFVGWAIVFWIDTVKLCLCKSTQWWSHG